MASAHQCRQERLRPGRARNVVDRIGEDLADLSDLLGDTGERLLRRRRWRAGGRGGLLGTRRGGGGRSRRCRRRGSGCSGGHRRGRVRGCVVAAEAEPGRVQAAQGLVEGGDVTLLRVVGEQRQHVIVLAAQHVLDETVQRLLRSDLHEHARAGVVQRLQPLDELHRGGDLLPEDVDHGVDGGALRVELTGHVGHDRAHRRLDVEAAQHLSQWFAGRGDDRGVEGVAHRDAGCGDAGGVECLDGASRPTRCRRRSRPGWCC